ncbi:3-dehydrosphinganine reductase [Geranomyces michiganensis]|nr:3-dehydrosphinganine reductase [Geranomyces michiganensis]
MSTPNNHTLVLSILVASCLLLVLTPMLFKKRTKWSFNPENKHVYITGGSQGTGLALAKRLAAQGAHVTIVARTVAKLETAKTEITAACRSREQRQTVQYQSANLCSAEESARALSEAERVMGKKVDYVFLCAGGAKPVLFAEGTAEDLKNEMETDYYTAAFTAHAAVQSFRTHPTPSSCRLVFVSSICGLMGLTGYASYAAAKFAVRGLAESLRMELLLYGVRVHIFFPGTIYSPGYEEENKTKPAVTKLLEEADEGVTPDKAAEVLVRGIEREEYAIACDLTGNLIRSLTKGAVPSNRTVLDAVYASIGWVALSIWRRNADKIMVTERHRAAGGGATATATSAPR